MLIISVLSNFFYNALRVNDILQKLETFESELGFTEKGLTLEKLSKKLETNSKYLS